MKHPHPSIDRLRSLIGRECTHEGRRCRILDLLPRDNLLILQSEHGQPEIQLDQYGQAGSRGQEIHEIPLFKLDGVTPTDGLKAVLSCLDACLADTTRPTNGSSHGE